jgi:hypothetical protein
MKNESKKKDDESSGWDVFISLSIIYIVSVVIAYEIGSSNGTSNYRRMVNDRAYCMATGIDKLVCADIYK